MTKTEQSHSLALRFPPELALVIVACLWGLSFILIAIALRSCSPALLVSIRFTCGALVTALLLGKKVFKLTKTDWQGGFAAGSCMFFGYFLQTVGMQTIPSSISAFLTSLYVPFVPALQLLLFRKVPSLIVGVGIITAFIGMTIILDPTTLTFEGSFGELVTILCAVFCAFEILFISKFADKCSAGGFAFTQLTVVAFWASLYALAFEDIHLEITPSFVICMSILVGMVAVNQTLMSWGQRYVPAAKAALIYTLEPVSAGIVGVIVGEALTGHGIIGGIIVVLSVVICSWLPKYLKERRGMADA